MRTAIKKSTEWIHITLILAIISPLIYCLVAEQPDIIGKSLYLKCLVIILPVIATDFAISKCKGLFSYLIVCAVILVATVAVGWICAGQLRQYTLLLGYMTVLISETIFLVVNRMAERLRRKEEDDDSIAVNSSWRSSSDSLRTPSFTVLIFFVAAYAFALNLNNPAVCNAALFSGAAYTVITILHQYVCSTEIYLFLNKRTCNIPSKRIYGIGNGVLAIFFLLFILVLLPALLTVSNRHYHDFRESNLLIEFEYTEQESGMDMGQDADNPMEAFFEQSEKQKPTPRWLIILSYILGAAVLLIFMGALVKMIYDTFRAFRESMDENGDIVEELEETDEATRTKKARLNRRRLSERERVRKEYRKFIRRYRKERPAHYESPAEIEINAGIAESEECRELHRNYELARYGQKTS